MCNCITFDINIDQAFLIQYDEDIFFLYNYLVLDHK